MSAAFADRDDLARRLNRLRRRGVAVGWGTLLVGMQGFGWVDRQASVTNVVAIALDTLARDPDDDLVLALACLRENEGDKVERAMEALAEREGADYGLERGKWRLLLLEERMEALPADPVHGLLALGEFWDTFKNPEDGPYPARRRDDLLPMDPAQEDYEAEVARHKRWMEGEEKRLRQADAVPLGAVLPHMP